MNNQQTPPFSVRVRRVEMVGDSSDEFVDVTEDIYKYDS